VTRAGEMAHLRKICARVAVAAVAVCLATAVGASAAGAALPDWSAYVANNDTGSSGTVSTFDLSVNPATATTFGVAMPNPGPIAIAPNGEIGYVGSTSTNEIASFDTTTNQGGGPFTIGPSGTAVTDVAFAPDGQKVWVLSDGGEEIFLSSLEPETGAIKTTEIPLPGGAPVAHLALSPDGSTAYIAANGELIGMIPVDLTTDPPTPGTPFPLPGVTRAIAITPDGQKAVIAESGDPAGEADAWVIDLATQSSGPAIPLDIVCANGIAITPDGSTAYIGGCDLGDHVVPVDIASETAGPPIATDLKPNTLAVTPDGSKVYVPSFSDNETQVIDTASNTLDPTTIEVGDGPEGIAITPDQAPDAALQVTVAPAGSSSTFDASASTVKYGSIATYEWNFGDGSTMSTTSEPVVSHTYSTPGGSYTATVTETSSGGTSTTQVFTGHTMSRNGGPQAVADANVVVPRVVPTFGATSSPDVPIGGSVHDTATLSGGENPTGTITFELFGPEDATCANPPVSTTTVDVTAGNGSYPSPDFIPAAVGTYRWTVSYSGDSQNEPGTVDCNAGGQTVTVSKVAPTLGATSSPDVPIGGSVHDTVTLSGGENPTGTITFELFGPEDATCAGAPVSTTTVDVTAGNGSYPSPDFIPAAVGTYRWTASYSGDSQNEPGTVDCNAGGQTVTVSKVAPTVAAQSSPDVLIGEAVHDTATLSGGESPTGTITFELFGPEDATCAGAPVSTTTVNVTAGNGSYPSPDVTPAAVGTYRWTASYSGDSQNEPGTVDCNAGGQTVTVSKWSPSLTAQASSGGLVGQPVVDTATLAGGDAPTGTVTFSLYGPNDPTCSGAPVDADTVSLGADGTATTSLTPPLAGVYVWSAAYSGDAHNLPAMGTCGGAAGTVSVAKATPNLTTLATATAALGGSIADTATLAGGYHPTGSITFRLAGPGDDTCAAAPVFTAVLGAVSDTSVASGPFTPLAGGAYRWQASYSGDANNNPVTAPCNADDETSTVTSPTPPGPPITPGGPPAAAPSNADVSVKLGGPSRATVGKTVTYAITIANRGPATARAITLSTTLSSDVRVTRVTGAACRRATKITCRLSQLAPGQDTRIRVAAVPRRAGRLMLTSTVHSATTDPRPGDNRARLTIRIAAPTRHASKPPPAREDRAGRSSPEPGNGIRRRPVTPLRPDADAVEDVRDLLIGRI
jgi:uncharacterized repeat protein (TIGR01451 family)